MNWKKVMIILPGMVALMLGLSGCSGIYTTSQQPVTPCTPNSQTNPVTTPTTTPVTTSVIPRPPEVPSEVLSIWKAASPSEAFPAYTSGKVTLEPNLHGVPAESSGDDGNLGVSYYAISAGADQTSAKFYLEEGQWIDIMVTSIDIPIYFQTNKPGGVSFSSMCWGPVSGNQVAKPLGLADIPNTSHHPYSEKALYENSTTSTYVGSVLSRKATIFSTAARIFAWGGAGEYAFDFTNFNSQKGADIQYRIYKLGATPAWGNTYANTMLTPWLNELHRLSVSGSISEQEYDNVINQWIEQFK